MSSVPFIIRRLQPADAALFRAIRLEALDRHPEAFGATYAEEDGQLLDFFAGRLETSVVFGAVAGAEIAGTAGIYFDPDAHETGTLWAVYVRHAQRRTGLGERLVEAAIADVRPRATRIRLKVNAENRAAVALYERLGFAACGIEKGALIRGGRAYDEIVMERTAG